MIGNLESMRQAQELLEKSTINSSGNWLPFLIEVIKIILMKDTKSFFFIYRTVSTAE